MRDFKDYLNEAKADRSGSRVNAMDDLVHALRTTFDKYEISTRNYVWDHLNTARGKELVHKILRNPKTPYTDSEFRKLLMIPKK